MRAETLNELEFRAPGFGFRVPNGLFSKLGSRFVVVIIKGFPLGFGFLRY